MSENKRKTAPRASFQRSRRRKAKNNRGMLYACAACALVVLLVAGAFLIFGGGHRADPAVSGASATPDAPERLETATKSEATPQEAQAATRAEAPAQTAAVPRTTPLMLPVCKALDTKEKVVAITVDDCFDAASLITIVDAARAVGGKITVFPIGYNLNKEDVAQAIKYAYANGCEIENHTWSHAALFDLNDEQFAQQIWYQNRAVSMLLGVDYQMHFLRSRGGDNKNDQRTHYYMNQLGYYGFAHWRLIDKSGEESLLKNIRPGDILLFHTNTEDTKMLTSMIPKLAQQGYKLVTLNELYGLPENETSPLTEETVFEPLAGYTYIPETLKYGDYMYAVLQMQARLSELGYLKVEYNGYYGKTTRDCVSAFQKQAGIQETGVADVATQQALFAQGAPAAK